MEAHAAHSDHPPVANVSSRVDARLLGMFLFIASEVMLFGSFFTAYFFVRVVNGYPWPPHGFHLPIFVAGVNSAILLTSSATMHWALQSIKRGNRAGLQAGLTQGNVGLIGAYVHPSCAIIACPFATHSKFRKRSLQKTHHHFHVTHTKVCMFKPDSHCAPPMRPHSRSADLSRNRHRGHAKNSTSPPCSEAVLTRDT